MNPASVWNCYKNGFFLLHPAGPDNIHIAKHHPLDLPPLMIVCSCNVLSDHDVRNAVNGGGSVTRNAKQVYGCLGCSAECGRCARTIKAIIDEALGPCAKACCSGCPHSGHPHAANEDADPAEFALAAC